MRYLAIDLGTRRIGLALGDADTGVVSPLRMLTAAGSAEADARAILAVAAEYGADALVLGLPLNMDGSEGPQAKLSKGLAAALTSLGGRPVHLHDERLTSDAADHRLLSRELTRRQKKARQDGVAAAILLESFLAASGGADAEQHGDEG